MLIKNAAVLTLVLAAVAPAQAVPERTIIAAPDQVNDGVAAIRNGDYSRAVRIFMPLAQSGNSVAQADLGGLYVLGRGVPQDFKESVKWFALSAEQGNRVAEFELGDSYYRGRGVAKDYEIAARWLLKAAVQGEPNSQMDLGLMYADGDGRPVNLPRAFMWYSLVAEKGGKSATSERDKIRSKMNDSQMKTALQMITLCKASGFKDCS